MDTVLRQVSLEVSVAANQGKQLALSDSPEAEIVQQRTDNRENYPVTADPMEYVKDPVEDQRLRELFRAMNPVERDAYKAILEEQYNSLLFQQQLLWQIRDQRRKEAEIELFLSEADASPMPASEVLKILNNEWGNTPDIIALKKRFFAGIKSTPKETLAEAQLNVATEYAKDLVEQNYRIKTYGEVLPENIDDLSEKAWQLAVASNPEYADRIAQLRITLDTASCTARAYDFGPDDEDSIRPHALSLFKGVKNEMARDLLADIFLARITKYSGELNYSMEHIVEANKMAVELGFEVGGESSGYIWDSFAVENVTHGDVVKGVLNHTLRVTYNSNGGIGGN